MANTANIKVGDMVNAVVSVWSADENPTDANFFTGRVKNIVRRDKYNVYFQIEKLDRNIPADRVSLAV